MIQWELKKGNKKLKEEISYWKENFNKWFDEHWSGKISKEEILSENSPVKDIYYKMTKSLEEIIEEFPYSNKEQCDFCDDYVDEWFKGTFDNLEYKSGINVSFNICSKCLEDIITSEYLKKYK